jgi:osmoprotectant transport system ATP-binding protein
MFELRHVTCRYGGQLAVSGVDLRIARAQTAVLVGPSGCGKSTVLKSLLGLVRPTEGQVRFEGEPITEENVRQVRRRIGYVAQGGGLFPHLSARRNTTLMATQLGQAKEQIDARVKVLCELTRFPLDGLDRFPAQLSGGQAQRVGLMRALMLEPEALLLDEPLAALDPITRFDLQADLRDIFRRLGKTVCLVTHDLGEAAFFADRIVLMREGRVVQEGSLRDLVNAPVDPFVTRFVHAHRVSPEP